MRKREEGRNFVLPNYLEPVRVELHGNRSAGVEGCSGILIYESGRIKIRAGKMTLCFTVSDLKLSCMDRDSLLIEGRITSLEYGR